jgi:hypothetical protein
MRRSSAIKRTAFATLFIFAISAAATAQGDSIYRLPAGTRIRLKMDVEINSRISSVNDTFTTAVAKPVMIRDTVALPAGTVIEGRVSNVSAAAGGGQAGRLEVVFETLRFSNGTTSSILGEPVNGFSARPSRRTSMLSIFGGTLAGLLIGASTGSPRGILVGAGVGAGIGTGIALARKGDETRIRKDQEFEIVLKKQLVLPVLDY